MVMARHPESESKSSCAQDTKAEYLLTPLHTRMKLEISRPPVFYLHVLLPLLTKVSTYAIWSSRSTNQSRGWGMSDQSGPSISLVSWQQQASVLERIATKRWFFSCSHFLVRRTNLSDLCVLCQFDPDSDFGSTIIFLSVLLHPSDQYYFRHRVYFKMQHIRFIPFQKLFLCYQNKTVSSNSAWLTSKIYVQRRESDSSHWDTFGKV